MVITEMEPRGTVAKCKSNETTVGHSLFLAWNTFMSHISLRSRLSLKICRGMKMKRATLRGTETTFLFFFLTKSYVLVGKDIDEPVIVSETFNHLLKSNLTHLPVSD